MHLPSMTRGALLFFAVCAVTSAVTVNAQSTWVFKGKASTAINDGGAYIANQKHRVKVECPGPFRAGVFGAYYAVAYPKGDGGTLPDGGPAVFPDGGPMLDDGGVPPSHRVDLGWKLYETCAGAGGLSDGGQQVPCVRYVSTFTTKTTESLTAIVIAEDLPDGGAQTCDVYEAL